MKVVIITIPDDTPNPDRLINAALQAAGVSGRAATADGAGANSVNVGEDAANATREGVAPVAPHTPPRQRGGVTVPAPPRTPTRERVTAARAPDEQDIAHGTATHPIVISPAGTAEDPIAIPATPSRINGHAALLTTRSADSLQAPAQRDPPPPYTAAASTSGSPNQPAGQDPRSRNLQTARRIGPPLRSARREDRAVRTEPRSSKKGSSKAARQQGTR
ncbi:hypothetical protein CPC08DRAFT_768817 [Agrocybe pediades]|nr:hypothetical protein CPC08DRAFT_768817 [Agrocybe pediades]